MNDKESISGWENAVKWLCQQPDKQQLVKDCYYDDPLTEAALRYWESEEWQSVRNILNKQSGTALDVGAGRGIASYALARDGFTVTALEPDPSALVGSAAIRKLATETKLEITVEEDFSEHLPFKTNSFDVVFARAILHHTDDLSAACSEFFRVLKPNGILLAIREHVISDKSDLQDFFEIHPLHRHYGGENAFLLNEYTTSINNAGFEKLQVISPWHSAINYAPYDLASLKLEIASRFGLASKVIHSILKNRIIWRLARILISISDNRPGRLYSFVAYKPSS